MLLYNLKLLLFSVTLFTITLGMSSFSMVSIWVAMELNLVSFVGLILLMSMNFSAESAVKYFVVQAFSSSVFFCSMMLSLVGLLSSMAIYMTLIPLLVKLGMAPFHLWMVELMGQVNWWILCLASTVQKLLPLMVLMKTQMPFMNLWILASLMASTLGSLSQVWVKKFMAYSSVFATAWMVSTLSNLESMIIFWVIYLVTMTVLSTAAFKKNIISFAQMKTQMTSINFKFEFFFSLYSIAGIPPMIGFVGKVMVIQTLLFYNEFMLSLMLLIFSVIIFLIYTEILIMYFLKSLPSSIMAFYYNESLLFLLMMVLPVIFIMYMFKCKARKILSF